MMQTVIDLSPYKSLLCLNGHLPDKSFFTDLQLPIIAADGAANSLVRLGLSPDLIIGDLDSVSPVIRASHKVLHCPEQSTTDFQKCLAHLKENNLLPAVVVGINGGHLDHLLNNIAIFLTTNSILYAPPLVGYVLKENTQQKHKLPLNSKLSIFGMPNATVSTRGLKWELKEAELSFPGTNSCFNRSNAQNIEMTVHQGAALVLIYTEAIDDAGGSL